MTIASYQVLTKKRDVNGNPFLLIICLDRSGEVVRAVECRQSRPNFLHSNADLNRAKELDRVELKPRQYNEIKRKYSQILEHNT